MQDSNPRPSDLSFPAPHTIRPRAHGRVTSFPAYTNLTDKEINKDIYMTVNSTRDFIPPEPFEGQNYKPRYARPSASLREELKCISRIVNISTLHQYLFSLILKYVRTALINQSAVNTKSKQTEQTAYAPSQPKYFIRLIHFKISY